MNWVDSFFITNQEQISHITGSYNYTLVALSVVIAAVASFIALHFSSMTRHIQIERYRHISVIAGASIMAGGVWSMHFVGMLAYDMGAHVAYDTTLTFISILPSLIASYITLKMLQKSRLKLWQLIISSVYVGAGIGIMHYTGMAAMEMQAELRYMPGWFATSIVVAVLLAFVALSVRYYLALFWQDLSSNIVNAVSATIMGIAIAGMHYTGMVAARFVVDNNTVITQDASSQHIQLSYIVAFTALLISALAAAIASQLRYRQSLSEKTTNERRLQTIMETAVDGIFTIDSNGIIQDFNQSATEIFGWQASDVIGQSFFKLVPEDAIDEYRGYLSSFQSTGQTQISGHAREVFAKHKDGHVFPIRLGLGHIQTVELGSMFVSFVTDISERWEMQEKLRKSEEQYSSLVRNIPGASFRCLLDEHWTAVLVSDGITDLCGWTPDDMYQGRIRFSDLIHPDDVEKTDQAVTKALDEKSNYTVEYRWQHRSGHYIWVLENGSIIWDGDNPLWIDGLILDISQRVQMEDKLRLAKEEAELSAESKAMFLANMSHEIRTPMNAVIGFTDILNAAEDISAENKKHLNTISQSARSLLHLLNDVLDSAKLEKSKLELDQAAFSITRLVDTVVSTLWLQARNKGLYLNIDISSDLHPAYLGDENRLRQILLNLTGNAIKFTEKGGVTLSVSVSPNQHVRFSIDDTGIGMDQATLEHVFEPFSQADASMSRRFGGTGLGTTISQQLVVLMDGELHASSELGVGSTFFFEVPLEETDAIVDASIEQSVTELPPQKVLIADDIEQNLTLLTLLLERQKHQVIKAENGERAMELFRETQPDIILMDLQMPIMDGFSATKLIREYEADNSLKPTPIVALTASVLSEDRIEAKQAGMDGFAHKPVDIKTLTHEMARVLGFVTKDLTSDETVQQLPANPDSQIHLKQGIELWGNHSNYIQELMRFLNQYAAITDTLTMLSQQSDFDELGKLTHRLKGLSGNLSLIKIYHLSITLEQNIVARNLAELNSDIVDLSTAMKQLKQEVNELSESLNVSYQTRGELTTLSTDETIKLLDELSALTKLGELDEEMLDKLMAGIDADLHSLALEVKTAIDDFDFKAANTHLDAIKNQLNLNSP